MPWEQDGPRWHTKTRTARNGRPCHWDGRILQRIVDRIHALGEFGATNWSNRTIVEIAGATKCDGWFFHALTGDEWLLTLKFRVAKLTFQRDAVVQQLALVPLDEMPDLPVYGREPRVACKNLRGPWQEIKLRVHGLEELDKPAFWQFLESAVGGFQKHAHKAQTNPNDLMPWKVLGEKWHLARKGFPLGRTVQWDASLLPSLCNLLRKAAPDGQFEWRQQQVVHVRLGGDSEVWASLFTKRCAGLDLVLAGPKGAATLGRVAELGRQRQVKASSSGDVVKLRFCTAADLKRGDLAAFLKEHAVLAEQVTSEARL